MNPSEGPNFPRGPADESWCNVAAKRQRGTHGEIGHRVTSAVASGNLESESSDSQADHLANGFKSGDVLSQNDFKRSNQLFLIASPPTHCKENVCSEKGNMQKPTRWMLTCLSRKLLEEPQMFCPRSFLNNDGESLTNNINKTIHGPINILYTWCNTSQVGRGFVCGIRGPYHGFEENFGRTTVS